LALTGYGLAAATTPQPRRDPLAFVGHDGVAAGVWALFVHQEGAATKAIAAQPFCA